MADVTKSGCTLTWQKPEDDGGTPIEYYEIEKLDPLTGKFDFTCQSMLILGQNLYGDLDWHESKSIGVIFLFFYRKYFSQYS